MKLTYKSTDLWWLGRLLLTRSHVGSRCRSVKTVRFTTCTLLPWFRLWRSTWSEIWRGTSCRCGNDGSSATIGVGLRRSSLSWLVGWKKYDAWRYTTLAFLNLLEVTAQGWLTWSLRIAGRRENWNVKKISSQERKSGETKFDTASAWSPLWWWPCNLGDITETKIYQFRMLVNG